MSHYIRGDECNFPIKPCPHCGKLETVFFTSGKGNEFEEEAYCDVCYPYHLENWNSRPIEDSLKSEIERLKARAAEMQAAGDAMASALTDEMYSYSLDDPGNAAIMELLVKWLEVRG